MWNNEANGLGLGRSDFIREPCKGGMDFDGISPMPSRQEPPVRGFFFWSLSPFLAAFVVLMPFLVQERSADALITLVAVELLAVLALLGLFHPSRFWWAWRGVGAIIFLGYAAYVIVMILEGKFIAARRAEPAVSNAVIGLFVFGLPGLWFALSGRLTPYWRSLFKDKEPAPDGDDDVAT